MPWQWTDSGESRRLRLWPHRSLPPRGFAAVIAVACGFLLLPLVGVLGTMAFWGLLPFLALAVTLLWVLLRRSYADGALTEELTVSRERMELVHRAPRGAEARWQANPYWVELRLRQAGGRVENYITLKGAGREVEIGAFLSPEERETLHAELASALARARGAGDYAGGH